MERDKRYSLDGPPKQPKLRSAPLSTLAGGDEGPNSPNGNLPPSQDDSLGAFGSDPTIQGMRYLAGAVENLEKLSGIAPGTMALVQDTISILKQVVPQALAQQLAGPGAIGSTGAPSNQSSLMGMAGMTPPPPPQLAGMGGPGGAGMSFPSGP